MNVLDQTIGENFALYHGDCVEVLNGLPARSVHYSIFSPPFASLYTYSNSPRDTGALIAARLVDCRVRQQTQGESHGITTDWHYRNRLV